MNKRNSVSRVLLTQLGNTRQQQWLCFFNLSNKLHLHCSSPSDGLYNGYLTLDHDNLATLLADAAIKGSYLATLP